VTESGEDVNPVKTIYGRAVKFKLGEDDVMVSALALSDGGIQIEFDRAGRILPVRISKTGAEALVVLLQDLFWHAPPIPAQPSTSSAEQGK
jgi:hypothetical protein